MKEYENPRLNISAKSRANTIYHYYLRWKRRPGIGAIDARANCARQSVNDYISISISISIRTEHNTRTRRTRTHIRAHRTHRTPTSFRNNKFRKCCTMYNATASANYTLHQCSAAQVYQRNAIQRLLKMNTKFHVCGLHVTLSVSFGRITCKLGARPAHTSFKQLVTASSQRFPRLSGQTYIYKTSKFRRIHIPNTKYIIQRCRE